VTFRAGEAVLYGVRECEPCRYIEHLIRPGLMEELAGRGGLRVRIVVGGRIRIGDRLVLVEISEDAQSRS
jgi:MOSC domain-containing protein YiiM